MPDLLAFRDSIEVLRVAPVTQTGNTTGGPQIPRFTGASGGLKSEITTVLSMVPGGRRNR